MNTYIHNLIKEQFNIAKMNLDNNKPKKNINIFNKSIRHLEIYDNMLNNKRVSNDDIEYMNGLVSEIKIRGKHIDKLQRIISFYSARYPNASLNWINVSKIGDMSTLFRYTNYNGDIS